MSGRPTTPAAAPTPTATADLVPLIDMERWRSGGADERHQTAEDVDAALGDVGFLIITNHGIPMSLIDDVRQASAEAFALPPDTKLKYRQSNGTGGPGWTPIGAEANSYASGQAAPPDLKETWTVAPVGEGAVVPTSGGVIPVINDFPVEVPSFKPAMERYLAAGLDLSAELFELLAVAAGLPADTFAKQCTEPLHNFNLTWYPPIGDDMADPEPGQFALGRTRTSARSRCCNEKPPIHPCRCSAPVGRGSTFLMFPMHSWSTPVISWRTGQVGAGDRTRIEFRLRPAKRRGRAASHSCSSWRRIWAPCSSRSDGPTINRWMQCNT